MRFDAEEEECLAGNICALHAKRDRRDPDPRVRSRRRDRGVLELVGAGS